MGVKLKFRSNNFKGLQNSLKRIKIFEYLKINLGSNWILYLQEIHSSLADGKRWADELKGPIIFSHGKINSWAVAIRYIEKRSTFWTKKLILDDMVNEINFVLVNIYNPNIETEQVTTLLGLGKMLETIKDFSDKHIVLAVYFNFFLMHP